MRIAPVVRAARLLPLKIRLLPLMAPDFGPSRMRPLTGSIFLANRRTSDCRRFRCRILLPNAERHPGSTNLQSLLAMLFCKSPAPTAK